MPYYGSWADPRKIYATNVGQRVVMDADQLQGVFMPNPKDVRIAQLEAEVAALKDRG